MYEASEYVGSALEQSVEGAFFLSFSRKNCQKADPRNTTENFEKNYQSISVSLPLLPKMHKYELQRLG